MYTSFFCAVKFNVMMFKKYIVTATLFLLTIVSQAQTGKIIGKIVDAKTGETLPGATVLIEGTTSLEEVYPLLSGI